jgi:hypothetical protein
MAVQNNTMTDQERARLANQTPGLARAAVGLRDAAVGVVARPVTALQDAARVGATRLLGGDPSTLQGGADRFNSAAQQLTSRGLNDFRTGVNEVVEPVRMAGLEALGAQPTAQQATVQPAAQPITTSAQTPPTPPPAQVGGMPARTAADLEGINRGLAYSVAATQAPAPIPAERGNYNVANTSIVDARGNITSTIGQNTTNPISIVGGEGRGYGGFGPGEARAYLDRMSAQDAQEQAQLAARRAEASEAVDRIGLRNAMTQGTPQERRAARQQLEGLDQQAALRLQQTAETQRQSMQGASELQRTGLAGQFGLQQEAMRGESALAQADLTGQYGLAGREAIAQSRVLAEQMKGNTGAELKAQAEAMRLARQQAIAAEYELAGDFAGRDRALGISQPGSPRLTQDALGNVIALDGRPVTAAEAEAYRQSIGFYKTPGQ